jgi:glycosyltransferase involved in cell wall biosynthesis
MIRVAHVITMLELGGAQENTLHTVAHLDRSRFEVALYYGPGGILDPEARQIEGALIDPVESLVRPISPRDDARALRDLVRRFRAFAPHIVHTHSSKAGIVGRLAARAANVPVIVHSIHGFGFYEGQAAAAHAAFVAAEVAAAKVTDAFISVSRANIAEGRARGIIGARHRVELIRSGFDLAAFRREAEDGPRLRAELGLTKEDEVFVAIANLKPQKDPLVLVRAMALVARRRPKAVLLYVGDGDLRGAVEAEIARLRIEPRFRLLGWRRDVAALIGASDVVVLSSIFEGLPRSAVQAVLARRPFVGTRVDGTPEIIHDGTNGFLVEPRSPERLAEAMERGMIERPVDPEDERRVLDWDATRMVAAQERLYESLV